jgi:hypothetical protein
MRREVIFCAALGAIFPYPALAVTDEASGLAVDPTPPFIATITSELGSAPSISVSSNTGAPATEGGDHIACSVGFQEATSNALLTQEKINQISAAPGFIGLTKRRFETAFEVGEPTTFSVAGVTGIEFDGIGKPGAIGEDIHVYYALMQTPKGATVMSCFIGAEYFDGALPQFQAIRDTINPPK